MQERQSRRVPHPSMVAFRAICCIHCSFGWTVIPAMSTLRLKMDEKQHVVCHQSAQRKYLHCEKVGPRQHRQVSPNECCPGGCLLARRCGRYAVTAQNITDRLIRDLMPEIG